MSDIFTGPNLSGATTLIPTAPGLTPTPTPPPAPPAPPTPAPQKAATPSGNGGNGAQQFDGYLRVKMFDGKVLRLGYKGSAPTQEDLQDFADQYEKAHLPSQSSASPKSTTEPTPQNAAETQATDPATAAPFSGKRDGIGYRSRPVATPPDPVTAQRYWKIAHQGDPTQDTPRMAAARQNARQWLATNLKGFTYGAANDPLLSVRQGMASQVPQTSEDAIPASPVDALFQTYYGQRYGNAGEGNKAIESRVSLQPESVELGSGDQPIPAAFGGKPAKANVVTSEKAPAAARSGETFRGSADWQNAMVGAGLTPLLALGPAAAGLAATGATEEAMAPWIARTIAAQYPNLAEAYAGGQILPYIGIKALQYGVPAAAAAGATGAASGLQNAAIAAASPRAAQMVNAATGALQEKSPVLAAALQAAGMRPFLSPGEFTLGEGTHFNKPAAQEIADLMRQNAVAPRIAAGGMNAGITAAQNLITGHPITPADLALSGLTGAYFGGEETSPGKTLQAAGRAAVKTAASDAVNAAAAKASTAAAAARIAARQASLAPPPGREMGAPATTPPLAGERNVGDFGATNRLQQTTIKGQNSLAAPRPSSMNGQMPVKVDPTDGRTVLQVGQPRATDGRIPVIKTGVGMTVPVFVRPEVFHGLPDAPAGAPVTGKTAPTAASTVAKSSIAPPPKSAPKATQSAATEEAPSPYDMEAQQAQQEQTAHHSQLQPRNEAGQFAGPPQETAPTAIHGTDDYVKSLTAQGHEPDIAAIHGAIADAAAKRWSADTGRPESEWWTTNFPATERPAEGTIQHGQHGQAGQQTGAAALSTGAHARGQTAEAVNAAAATAGHGDLSRPGDVAGNDRVRSGESAQPGGSAAGSPSGETAPVTAEDEHPPFRFETVDPATVGVLPGMQYKRVGIVDKAAGVTAQLKNQRVYDVGQGNELTIFRDGEGKNWVVNGHHRLELAGRAEKFIADVPVKDQAGEPTGKFRTTQVPRQVRVKVLDARDGWTPEMARTRGAIENMREGKGEPIDAADALHALQDPEAMAAHVRSLPQTPFSRDVAGLTRLDQASREAVRNGEVKPQAAAAIGDVLGHDPERVRVAMEQARKNGIESYKEAANMAASVRDEPVVSRADAAHQLGFEGFDNDSQYVSTAGSQAKIRTALESRLTREKSNLLATEKTAPREGETFDTEGRRADAAVVGEAKSKAALLLDHDPEVKAALRQAGMEHARGTLSTDDAAARVRDVLLANAHRTPAEVIARESAALNPQAADHAPTESEGQEALFQRGGKKDTETGDLFGGPAEPGQAAGKASDKGVVRQRDLFADQGVEGAARGGIGGRTAYDQSALGGMFDETPARKTEPAPAQQALFGGEKTAPADTSLARRPSQELSRPVQGSAAIDYSMMAQPNTVFHLVKGDQDQPLELLTEPYDGTPEGAQQAQKRLFRRAMDNAGRRAYRAGREYSTPADYSHTLSQTGATDAQGKPAYVLAPSGRVIKAGTDEARYAFGDMEAGRRVNASEAAQRGGNGANDTLFQNGRKSEPAPTGDQSYESIARASYKAFQERHPAGAPPVLGHDIPAVAKALTQPDAMAATRDLGDILRRALYREVQEGQSTRFSQDDITRLEQAYDVKPGAGNGGKWATDASDRFGTDWARYLQDGRAPTPKLQQVFDTFKSWLTRIYASLHGTPLEGQIHPDVRDVFDRLLGGDTAKTGNESAVAAAEPTTEKVPPVPAESTRQSNADRVNVGGTDYDRYHVTDHASLADALHKASGGRLTPEQARDTAALYESAFRGIAKKQGTTVAEVYQKNARYIIAGDATLARALGDTSGTAKGALIPGSKFGATPEDRHTLLALLANPDPSTAVHELGHIFLTNLKPADANIVRRWLNNTGHEIAPNAPFTTEHHEAFAQGFERSVADGHVLHPSLTGVYSRFKEFLRNVYTKVVTRLSPAGQMTSSTVDRTKTFPLFDKQTVNMLRSYAGDVSDITGRTGSGTAAAAQQGTTEGGTVNHGTGRQSGRTEGAGTARPGSAEPAAGGTPGNGGHDILARGITGLRPPGENPPAVARSEQSSLAPPPSGRPAAPVRGADGEVGARPTGERAQESSRTAAGSAPRITTSVEDAADAAIKASPGAKPTEETRKLAQKAVQWGRDRVQRAADTWPQYRLTSYDQDSGNATLMSPREVDAQGNHPEYTVNVKTGYSSDPDSQGHLAKINQQLADAGMNQRVVSKHVHIARELIRQNAGHTPDLPQDILFQKLAHRENGTGTEPIESAGRWYADHVGETLRNGDAEGPTSRTHLIGSAKQAEHHLRSAGLDTSALRKAIDSLPHFQAHPGAFDRHNPEVRAANAYREGAEAIRQAILKTVQSRITEPASDKSTWRRELAAYDNPVDGPTVRHNFDTIDNVETGDPLSLTGFRQSRGDGIPGTGRFYSIDPAVAGGYGQHKNFSEFLRTTNTGGPMRSLEVTPIQAKRAFVVEGGHRAVLREMDRQGVNLTDQDRSRLSAALATVRKSSSEEGEAGYQQLDKIVNGILNRNGYDALVYRQDTRGSGAGKSNETEVAVMGDVPKYGDRVLFQKGTEPEEGDFFIGPEGKEYRVKTVNPDGTLNVDVSRTDSKYPLTMKNIPAQQFMEMRDQHDPFASTPDATPKLPPRPADQPRGRRIEGTPVTGNNPSKPIPPPTDFSAPKPGQSTIPPPPQRGPTVSERMGTAGRGALKVGQEAMNAARSVKASGNLHQFGRQMAVLGPANPRAYVLGAIDGVKAISKKGYEASRAEMEADPKWKEFAGIAQQEFGRYLGGHGTFTGKGAAQLGPNGQDEEFVSNLADRFIPGVAVSHRSFGLSLDRQGLEFYKSASNQLEKSGITLNSDPKAYRDLTGFVLAAQGRLPLQGRLAALDKGLNSVFFSPRFAASRWKLMNPAYYASLSPGTRKVAIQTSVAYAATVAAAMGAAHMLGATVSSNPADPDFGKVKTGNARYDLTAGFRTEARFGLQMWNAFHAQASGEKVKKSMLDIALQYARGKLAPGPAVVASAMAGKNIIGEPATAAQLAQDAYMPMFVDDLYQAFMAEGAPGMAKVSPAFFGVMAQDYKKGDHVPPATDALMSKVLGKPDAAASGASRASGSTGVTTRPYRAAQ